MPRRELVRAKDHAILGTGYNQYSIYDFNCVMQRANLPRHCVAIRVLFSSPLELSTIGARSQVPAYFYIPDTYNCCYAMAAGDSFELIIHLGTSPSARLFVTATWDPHHGQLILGYYPRTVASACKCRGLTFSE